MEITSSHVMDSNGQIKITSQSGPPVDLGGMADGLILDADGDSTLGSPTDDLVELKVGDSNVVSVDDHDVYLAGNTIGISARYGSEWLGGVWDEHFEGTTIPSGWSWASTPFLGAPDAVDYTLDSRVVVTETTTAGRYFFYKAANTGVNNYFAMYSTNVNTTGNYGAIRLDDGTDDYYAEARIKIYSANELIIEGARKNGGSEITSTVSYTVPYPLHPGVRLNVSGTRWSNWNFNIMVFGTDTWQLGMVRALTYTPAFSWTPSRMGMVFLLSATAWQDWYLDAWKD